MQLLHYQELTTSSSSTNIYVTGKKEKVERMKSFKAKFPYPLMSRRTTIPFSIVSISFSIDSIHKSSSCAKSIRFKFPACAKKSRVFVMFLRFRMDFLTHSAQVHSSSLLVSPTEHRLCIVLQNVSIFTKFFVGKPFRIFKLK